MSTHLWKIFSFKLQTSSLQLCLYYNYCHKLTLQDNYWRFSFSATCSAISAICSRSSLYCSSVQLAASPPVTTSTGALGNYDFMYAKTWFEMDFARCLT
jgi:hypothetical protein